jgi:glutamate racemase
MLDNRPIGIFDSGVGGLTVVKEIMKLLPDEQIIYLGDTARVPYGSKSEKSIKGFTLEASLFLLEHDVKMIIIACNSASSVAVDYMKKMFKIPFLGVIEPGAEAAIKKTENNKVGVIGTTRTIESDAYTKAIHRLQPGITVFKKACPLFVPLAEEGWVDHKITRMVANEYLDKLNISGIDTLILGCTHYPILKGIIQEVVSEEVSLIDSGVETAKITKNILNRYKLNANRENEEPNHIFYVTDAPDKFRKIGERFLGKDIENIGHVGVDTLVR